MPKNDLHSVRILLKVLRKPELDSLGVYLKAFNNMFGNYEPKTFKLLQILTSDLRYSDQRVREEVSPNVSDNTFRMLVMRLKEKIYECLTLDMNTKRADAYSHHYKNRFEVRKRLSQVEILHARGAIEEALYLCDKIIRLCKRYEIFEPLVQALHQKQEMLVVRNGTSDFIKLQEEIGKFRMRQDAFQLAKHHYYRLASEEEFRCSTEVDHDDYLDTIALLQHKHSLAPSTGLKYWLHLINLNYLEGSFQYRAALRVSGVFVKFIKKCPAIYMDRRLGSAYIHLAHNSLNSFEYDKCRRSARKAQTLFERDSFNELLAIEYEFYAAFHCGNYKRSESIVNQLVKRTDSLNSRFKHAKRNFLKAATLFKMKKYRRAHFALRDTILLDHDKGGWNVGVRILNIMNQIEWGGLNRPTEAFIENLNAHCQQLKEEDQISARTAVIKEVLNALMKNSFSFGKTYKDEDQLDNIRLLQGVNMHYRWRIPGPELVKFDVWFMQMMQNEKKVVRNENISSEQ